MAYFENFSNITYNGYSVKNILSRVKINDLVKESVLAYLPYTLQEGDKPWTVADGYYDNPNLSWLVYMSNDMIDPIYDWHLDTYQFENYLKKKYGSIAAAQANLEGYKDSDGVLYSVDSYTYNTDTVSVDGGDVLAKTLWTPIYSYDRESDDNDAKLTIKLLDKRFQSAAVRSLAELLNE